MMAVPVHRERAIYMPSIKAVAVADIHIGMEYEFSIKGANIPSQTESLVRRCRDICAHKNAETMLIVGDLKHTIAPPPAGSSREYEIAIRKERDDVKVFIEELADVVEMVLVKGNHDGGLGTGRKMKVYDSGGGLFGNIGFVHGHAWPSEEVMGAELLVMGHVHPAVRMRDRLGYGISRPCWVRAPLNGNALHERYENANAGMEVIIMPAFNPLCGGMAVNTEGIMGPMKKLIDLENASAYLLDGTNLGKVGDLP